MADQIDNFAPGGGVVDVTGGKISFVMRYADIGTTAATDHFLDIVSGGRLGERLAPLQAKALSELFDDLWQGKPDPDGNPTVDQNGKSLRDQTINTIDKAIKDAISSAFAFTNDISMTGTLRSFAAELHLFLSYKLGGCKVTFSVPIALGIDATVDLTFDIEILIILGFQDWPHVKPIVSVSVNNLDISAASLAATVIEGLANILGVDIKRLLESVAPPGQGSPKLSQSIATLVQTIEDAAVPAGFTSCVPEVDAGNLVIRLVLVHPIDPAPILEPVTAGDGGFFQPTLAVDRGQVHAGDKIVVTGSNFPSDQATRAGVHWNDTVTGAIAHSDIDVSVNNAPANRVTVPRTRLDNGNVFFATSLPPNARVTFSVRDCDQFTCTPFSNDVAMMTSLANQVDITLEAGGVSVRLPFTGSPDANGAFSGSVTIPPRTAPGLHRLSASVGAASAGIQITVLPDVQPIPRQLHQVDPNTGQIVSTLVTPNQAVAVRGDGFPPGRATVVIQLDFGQGFNSSPADGVTDDAGSFTARFQWPADSPGGTRRITALILAIPPEIGATLDVFVELPPH